jgi:prevent-host-death family protein
MTIVISGVGMEKYMKAGEFKARCLKVMDQVQKTGRGVIITKRNVPVAQVVPIKAEKQSMFGCMKGTVKIKKNIVKPIEEQWDALS